MSSLQASRTLVKSPPELWAELSDIGSLARHLGEFGEIRITKVDPESRVEWEADRASGTVRLEPSGWGTRVVLTVDTPEPDAEAVAEPEAVPAPEPPPVAVPEPEPVAEAVPDRAVVALLGDGELLMSANTLWTVAAYRPANLLAAVLTDGHYSITGGQPLPLDPRFADVAAVIPGLCATRVADRVELRDALRELPRPALVEVVVEAGTWPGPSPFVDPLQVRLRFAAAVASQPPTGGTR